MFLCGQPIKPLVCGHFHSPIRYQLYICFIVITIHLLLQITKQMTLKYRSLAINRRASTACVRRQNLPRKSCRSCTGASNRCLLATRCTDVERCLILNLHALLPLQECPAGIVNEDTFKHIYSQFFPQGGKYVVLDCMLLAVTCLPILKYVVQFIVLVANYCRFSCLRSLRV